VRLNSYPKILFITGIILLYITVTVLSVTVDFRVQPQDFSAPNFNTSGAFPDQVSMLNQSRLGCLELIRPLKVVIFKLKSLYWIDSNTAILRFAVTRNFNVAITTIAQFAIYYQLSRTRGENPPLPSMS
jgi:hypothetical protein